MVHSVLWYEKDEVVLLEIIGKYSLNTYVQACYQARDQFLEYADHPLHIIIDIRSMDYDPRQPIPVEPLESLLGHPQLGYIIFLANPNTLSLIEAAQQRLQQIHIAEYLDQVDALLAFKQGLIV